MSTVITKRQKPQIEWNDGSYKSWIHTGNDADRYHGVDFNRKAVINFMNRIDLTHGPLKQKIHAMFRVKGPEYDEDGESTDKTKEYLYYTVEYSGKDFWKQRINSGVITEGRHQVVPVEQDVKWELVNGNPVEHVKSVNGSPVIRHTIEFSKENVDKFLKKHNMEDKKDEILYYWKSTPGQGGFRCNEYSYKQFTESECEHLKWLYERIGGPTGKTNLSKETPAYADCTCSECAKQTKKKHDKTGRGVQ